MGQVQRLHLNAVAKCLADPGYLLAGQIHVEHQTRQAAGGVTQAATKSVHHALQSEINRVNDGVNGTLRQTCFIERAIASNNS